MTSKPSHQSKISSLVKWKSLEYRKYLRDKHLCITCGQPLYLEKETFETHHIEAHGGKDPSDQYLTPLCLHCHNILEHDEEDFLRSNGITNATLKRESLKCIIEYYADKVGSDKALNDMAILISTQEQIDNA